MKNKVIKQLSNRRFFTVVVVIVFALTAGVRAEDAPSDFQTFLLKHHYGAVRTDSEGDKNAQTFRAEINGKRVTLQIDTGSYRTVLTEACARRLHLEVQATGHSVLGVGAKLNNMGLAAVTSFKINGLEINHLSTIAVLPHGSDAPRDGLLGMDVMELNAMILPVGGHGFLIKPGPVPVVSIAPFMRNLKFTPVPVTFAKQELLVAGSLDGRPLRGVIDTGCAYTLVNSAFLTSFKGRIDELDGYAAGVDGHRKVSSAFTPHELKLGDFVIPPIMLTTMDSFILEHEKEDALIGYDILALHRAVIDMGTNTLWLR